MSLIYLCVISIFYVLVQAQNSNFSKLDIQYNNLVPGNNHTNDLNKGSKINFNDYLKTDPLFKNVIDVENVLQDSDIFFLCDKTIPDLNKSAELNLVRKYPGVLLCMGLSHVLLLNGLMLREQQNYSKSSILPQSKSDLDNLISNMNSNNSFKHEVMCKQHKVTLPTYKSGLEEYVKLLNPLLDNEDMCSKMCLTYEDTINPICVLIIEANSAFYNLVKQSHMNPIKPVENVDSVKAAELNSDIDTTESNTKDISEDDTEKNIPLNKGNVAALTLSSKDKSSTVSNDTGSVTHVISQPVKVLVSTKMKNNTNTPTPIIPKLDPDAGEILNDENSAENTDNADDYNIETAKQTSPSLAPVVTQANTNTPTNNTSKPVVSSQPNSKQVLVEEDNAHEAAEVESFNSKPKKTVEEERNEPKPVDATKKKSTTKKALTSSKTSEKTVLESKDEFDINDDQDAPPLLQEQEVVPLPPMQAPNVDTMEGDNILINANNNDEETFSSNINQKQQVVDAGDSVLDIQENTPYIIAKDGFVEAEDSHFFTYFVFMFVICIVMYVGFYNKRKILALALEGRAGRRTRSRRGTYSRVNTGYDESKEHLLY